MSPRGSASGRSAYPGLRSIVLFWALCLLPISAFAGDAVAVKANSSVDGKRVQNKRIVYFGVERGPAIPQEAHVTVDEAVRAQVGRAAVERGFVEVLLTQVMGLEERARTCKERACRLEMAKRLGVSHTLRGRLVRDRGGYAVNLYLEDAKSGAFLHGVRVQGDVPTVRGDLAEQVDGLLEKASPKDSVARERLAKTARAYLAKDRAEDAARTFQRASNISPFHPDAPGLFFQSLLALERAGDADAAWQATLTALDTWGPRSAWALAGIGDPAAVSATLGERVLARGTDAQTKAQELATGDSSNESVAAERSVLQKRAADAWEIYLTRFDDAPESADVALYLGELRYAQGRYVEAVAGYEDAMEAGLQGDGRQIAATSIVLALEKAVLDAMASGDLAPVELDGETTFAAVEVELSRAEQDLVDAIDRVAADFATVEDAPRFAYRAAHLHAVRGHNAEARRRFAEVAKRWPKSRPGRLAKRIVNRR